MNKLKGLLLLLILLSPAISFAFAPQSRASLQVEVIADDGRVFPLYALQTSSSKTQRAYLEAIYGSNYSIRVRNNSRYRRGLVIAVDGRNIISGQKSDLKAKERMYILEPWESATYHGWRTGSDRINRFFFTAVDKSYADAFGDRSATGVIAIAAFNQKYQYRKKPQALSSEKSSRAEMPMEEAASASGMARDSVAKKENRQAGTGFGEEQVSYARVVSFKPMKIASEEIFLKYEWRESLCEKHIVDCGQETPNRFWPKRHSEHGFAPYPPKS
ncbi:MAG: hypothetical protein GKR93_15905 [Gammaproteobacteria bacterium]|nr:hypothetical protein [Gammaproteobacteria bacterium]